MNQKTPNTPSRPAGRRARSSAAWKSGLLGLSLGAVLVGGALLARTNETSNTQVQASQSGAAALTTTTSSFAGNSQSPFTRSSARQPGFQRPLTATRGS